MATSFQPLLSGASASLESESESRVTIRGAAGGVSVTHVPVLVSDDIIAGSLTEAGRMSPVRRFFCLLVTFDVLFTGLLWVITVIVSGRDIELALRQQVLEYTIHSSMFDCVLCALTRFSFCILFYALLNLRHWWPIAVTTSGTSVFLIAKVFEYEWSKVNMLTFEVTLVLLSFILAWGELWFLDGRVLPLESKAKEIYANSVRNLERGDRGDLGERTPLVGTSAMLQRYMATGADTVSVTGSNFYSLAPPDDDLNDPGAAATIGMAAEVKRAKEFLKNRAKQATRTAWGLMNDPSDDWKEESLNRDTGDTVETKTVNSKKIFRVRGTLDIPARILLEELFYKIEQSPGWNSLVTECKIIKTLDSNTDILYQACASYGGGTISTRDFVYLRHWELIDSHYVCAHVSLDPDDINSVPVRAGRVRGESGPCCFVMCQSDEKPNKCEFGWLLNTDLKLSLPKFVLDKALIGSCHDFMGFLRKRVEEMHRELETEETPINSEQAKRPRTSSQ